MTIHHDDDLPMFARGIAGPLGKLDVPAKTKIDEQTHDLWRQYCALRGTHAAVAPQPPLSAAYFDPVFLNFIRSAVGSCRALWFCRIYGKKKPGLQAGQSLSEIGSRKP